jgi:hypothetical protein
VYAFQLLHSLEFLLICKTLRSFDELSMEKFLQFSTLAPDFELDAMEKSRKSAPTEFVCSLESDLSISMYSVVICRFGSCFLFCRFVFGNC